MVAPVRILTAAAIFCFAAPVLAQEDEPQKKAAAQELLDQASKAMDSHAYGEACPKVEEAMRLLPGKIGLTMSLGQCYEGLGRLKDALAAYHNAADLAARANDS